MTHDVITIRWRNVRWLYMPHNRFGGEMLLIGFSFVLLKERRFGAEAVEAAEKSFWLSAKTNRN
jgi:hypothetical protein